MKNTSIKNTAARLDRFKKPDHWTQRTVEYGFAVYAECVVANNRAFRKVIVSESGKSAFTPEFLEGKDIEQITPISVRDGFSKPIAHLGRRPLKPLNLTPFYKFLAVVVGLLMLSGLVHHFSP